MHLKGIISGFERRLLLSDSALEASFAIWFGLFLLIQFFLFFLCIHILLDGQPCACFSQILERYAFFFFFFSRGGQLLCLSLIMPWVCFSLLQDPSGDFNFGLCIVGWCCFYPQSHFLQQA